MSRVLRPSDRAAIVGVVSPAAAGGGAHESNWVPMSRFERLLAIVMTGDLDGASVNARLEQATDDEGTGAKEIEGTAITEIGDDGRQAVINLVGEDVDANEGFTHVRLTITLSGTGGDPAAIAGLVLGFDARYQPGSDEDLDSVVEII